MAQREVDVIVIGAGPAGETAAGRAADNGLDVAIVERELVGGECSYWACIPSKTLLRPGDVRSLVDRVPGAVGAGIDAAAALAHRDEMVSSYDDSGQLPWLTEKGIDLIRGHARLTGERAVEVSSGDGSAQQLKARRAVVVATGSAALIPDIEGLAAARPWDNRDATGAKAIPRRFLVLGGGPVGVEMAQAFRRLGSDEVSLVEAGERLLAREEPFAGQEVRAAFEAEGIAVRTGASVTKVRRTDEVRALLSDGSEIVADEVLVAVGRVPRTRDIGLESVGLTPGQPIAVDDTLRATQAAGEWLYGVGDVNGRVALTHVGKYQARIAGDVISGKPARDLVSSALVPRVTFTDPQVCAVGLTEEQARKAYPQVRVVRYGTGDVAGAHVLGSGITGTSQLIVDAEQHLIVGATFTGPEVAELLHSATVAIAGRVPLPVLWHAVPSFPTVSEVWLRLLEAYGL